MRRKPRHGVLTAVSLAAVSFTACTADTRPSDVTWSSPHFRYHTRSADDSVCSDVTDALEAHFDALRTAFETPWPDGAVTQYYKYRDADDIAANGTCSDGNQSCYLGARGIETAAPMEQHELVHALLSYLGDSHPALEEGVAEALSCGYLRRSVPPLGDPDELFSSSAWRQSRASDGGIRPLYDAAAWFVGYLLHTGTVEQFVDFYSALGPNAEAADVGAAFEVVYEGLLTAAWDEASRLTDPEIACFRVWECGTTEWTSDPLTQWNQSCAGADRVRSVPLSEPSFVTQTSPGSGLRLGSCDFERPVPHDTEIDALGGGNRGERFQLALPAGRYFVAASPYLDGPATLAIEPLAGKLGRAEDCDTLSTVPTEIANDVQFAFDRLAVAEVLGDPDATLVRLALSVSLPAASVGEFFATCSAGTTAQICTSCDPDDCTDVCGEGSGFVELPRAFTLRFDAGDVERTRIKLARVD